MKVKRVNSGKTHWYIDEDADGRRIPGVTTLAGDGMRKKALEKWNGTAVAEYAVDYWDNLGTLPPSERLKALKAAPNDRSGAAAGKGTKIHKYAEKLVHGTKVDIEPELAGYVQSAVNFINDFDFRAWYTEATVYSESRYYAGQLDAIGTLLLPDDPDYDIYGRDSDGRTATLLDWKTGASGIWGDAAYQFAGYRYADWLIEPDTGEIVPVPQVDLCLGVHLSPHGYTAVPLVVGPAQFRDFLFLKESTRIGGEYRALAGAPILPTGQRTYKLMEEVPR